jgi:hypothetical protein
MAPTRRRLLAAGLGGLAGLSGAAGCLGEPGRRCPGATVRLTLSPIDDRATASPSAAADGEPLVLDPGTLSTAADAVVETAIGGEHVERCVRWDGDPGPSAGLREVGRRLEAHLDVDLAGRREPVVTDVRREGARYRLELVFEASR